MENSRTAKKSSKNKDRAIQEIIDCVRGTLGSDGKKSWKHDQGRARKLYAEYIYGEGTAFIACLENGAGIVRG